MPEPLSIAIVGLGGVFPRARNVREFWQNIAAGIDAIGDVPPGRWVLDPADAIAPRSAAKLPDDHVPHGRGGYVGDFALDPEGLDLDAELLVRLDLSVQFALHAGRDAWREMKTGRLDRARVGVILAAIALPTDGSSRITRETLGREFERRLLGSAAAGSPREGRGVILDPLAALGSQVTSLPAGLLAAALGLGGGGLTLDAACASSLYAVKLACDELREHRCDAVLAGGVSRPECLYTQMGFAVLGALSPSGVCRPFDAAADGLLVGEGAGVVALKRLDDALRDGDQVYGVIRGIGLSNDLAGSLLAADSEGQLRAMRAAYEQAGWRPGEVDYIECHGTGTPLGDRVELESLAALWSGESWRPGQCAIGSVKSMVGHLLTAAGAAGLIKTLLAMGHGTVPPSLHFSRAAEPHPEGGARASRPQSGSCGIGDGPFRVPARAEAWDARDGGVRRAAISAFGFGGINAHVLVEQPPAGMWPSGKSTRRPRIAAAPPEPIAIVGVGLRNGPIDGPLRFARRWVENGDEGSGRLDRLEIGVGEFRIPPNEIPEILPQQLLMLQVAADAMRDAGIERGRPALRGGALVGLSLDLNTSNYHQRWALRDDARRWAGRLGLDLDDEQLAAWTRSLREAWCPPLSAARVLGSLGSSIASRLAREFGLGGPCYTVSCGAASGLRAVEIAARALRRGELDCVLVGAIDLCCDGRAAACHASLQRLVGGGPAAPQDGAAAVVLKRHSDAQRDGDHIYALIRGIGVAGGDGLSAAGEETARLAEQRAREDEAAAAADAAGDAVRFSSPRTGDCGAAAGLVSLAGAAVAIHHRVRPAADMLRGEYWLRNRADGPRRAAVRATSIDGTYVHVALEEAPRSASHASPTLIGRPALFVVCGDAAEEIRRALAELSRHLERSAADLDQSARAWHSHHTAQRAAAPRALALVVRDLQAARRAADFAAAALAKAPEQPIDGREGVYYFPQPAGPAGHVALVFPGSGSHYAGMGRSLQLAWPDVMEQLDRESERLAEQFAPAALVDAPVADLILRQVTFGALMHDILRDLGLRPHAVIGYSLGETTGLVATRAWKDRDEMLRRMAASPLFTRELAGPCEAARRAWNLPPGEPVDWHVAVVNRDAARVREALAGCSRVHLLIINSPGECVVGGRRQDVEQLVESLGCEAAPVTGASTVHCEIARQVEGAYRDFHLLETTPPGPGHGETVSGADGLTFYSAAAGEPYQLSHVAAAESILAQALHGFDFPRVIERAYADGVRTFIELGPGSTCTRMITRILAGRPFAARSASVESDEVGGVAQALAWLIAQRVIPDAAGWLRDGDSQRDASRHERRPAGQRVIRLPAHFQPGRPALPALPSPALTAPAPHAVTHRKEPLVACRAADGFAQLSEQLVATAAAGAAAHDSFLQFADSAMQGTAAALELHNRLLRRALGIEPTDGIEAEAAAPASPMPSAARPPIVVLNREQCLEFALGSVARVFGPQFAEVDTFAQRVRLPDEPLMLVDRVVHIEGEPGSLGGGRIVTEHDVRPAAWYLDNGRTPVCIAVEAGQADLMLCSYLGIDLAVRGERTYRLLDARIRFHRDLPRAGETIRYDIRIDRFVRQGDTWMFFFRFEGTIAGRPLITMTNGCAGFFTPREIEESRGIVRPTPEEPSDGADALAPPGGLPPMAVESYSADQLAALRAGSLADCFGPLFEGLPLRDPLRIPDGRMELLHRIVRLDPAGGLFGRGLIIGEADVHPDDWFLTCHFVDDMVMPGTLMYECCAHTLRVFLLRMGWVAEQSEAGYEPIHEHACTLKCRGPVTPETRVVRYELHIRRIGYDPEPHVVADAYMYADGKRIVQLTGMALRVAGLTRRRLEQIWWQRRASAPAAARFAAQCRDAGRLSDAAPPSAAAPPLDATRIDPIGDLPLPAGARAAIFDYDRILAFSIGRPSEAFGEPYRVFDRQRRLARLPGPPFLFLSRITHTAAEAWKLAAGGWIEAQYDVPPDAWYFAANRQRSMPFCVLLEIALQGCGWMAAYLGSALHSPVDARFRNLGGQATQYEEVFPDAGTLTTRIRIKDVSAAAGMIVEKFDMQVWRGRRIVYAGDTYFGFFSDAALSQQVGIRGAAERAYRPAGTAAPVVLPADVPLRPDDAARAPHAPACLPSRALLMLDSIDVYEPEGGPHGLGFIRGSKRIDPAEWFFAAHFYQDPVWPGSLGIEAMLQLLRYAALSKWGRSLARTHRFAPVLLGRPHEWVYRGQVTPNAKRVEVEAMIRECESGARPLLLADGFLKVDGTYIYEMKNMGLTLVPDDSSGVRQ